MDKSPIHPAHAHSVASPADLLLRAIQHALLIRKKSIIIGAGHQAWNPPSIHVAHPERQRYGPGLHAHDKPEICIALDGKAVMEVESTFFQFEAPSIAVFTPGVRHSELFFKRKSRYRLLWISMTGDSLLAILSCYIGDARWQIDRISPLQGPLVTRLRVACTRLDSDPAKGAEQIRGELLPVLSELYRYEVLGRTRQISDGPGRHAAQVVERARSFIDVHFNQPIDVSVVAELSAMSPNYLNTLFSRHFGMGIKAYLIKQRMERAMKLCESEQMMMKQISLAVGYDDPLYFSRVFRGYFGVTPTEARARSRG